jgi:hypothetical protein
MGVLISIEQQCREKASLLRTNLFVLKNGRAENTLITPIYKSRSDCHCVV